MLALLLLRRLILFPYWGICSNGICYERTKTHTMNILCCCLGLCGRGGHTRTDVLCDVHDMENKTQAFLNSPSFPSAF